MKPKILAYYLPAYHRIPENDKWHGEGFTEWDTTKKGEKFTNGQYQPRVPLNDYYYNLTKIEDLKWQCNLAKQYNVDGFCFYHYWFNGKKILEKPAEVFLNNKGLDREFCFAWANEEWRNTWNSKLEEPELLLAQNYDDLSDWENHFNYLLPFFKDERYLKLDNKPVFMIYRIESIPEYSQRFSEWDALAKKNGFSGIYLIQMINNDYAQVLEDRVISAKVDFEPNKTVCTRQRYALSYWRIRRMMYNKLVKKNFLHNFIYDKVKYTSFCKSMLKKKYIHNENYFHSIFVDWDNTARKGKRGLIFYKSSPQIFNYYFKKIYEFSIKESKEFIFIFAWNEWGEGAYLEPDKKNEYKYLEAIQKTVNFNAE